MFLSFAIIKWQKQKTMNEWSNIDVRGVANKTIVLRPIKCYFIFFDLPSFELFVLWIKFFVYFFYSVYFSFYFFVYSFILRSGLFIFLCVQCSMFIVFVLFFFSFFSLFSFFFCVLLFHSRLFFF